MFPSFGKKTAVNMEALQKIQRDVSLSYTFYLFKYAESLIERTRDLAKERCYGCEVDHPSQTHHTCLMWTDEEHFNIYFDDAFDTLDKDLVLAKWRNEIQLEDMSDSMENSMTSMIKTSKLPSRKTMESMARRMRKLEDRF